MKLTPVILDFESFWSVEHSLTKMNPISYVMHPETEIISVAAKVGKYPTDVIFGEDNVRRALHSINWSDKMVIGHNMSGFDAMILAWRFGIKPAMWGCTLAMAAPHHGLTVGGSLAKLVEHYGLGVKDQSALVQTKGRHLKDFTPDEIAAMEEYNKADTEQCAELFKRLFPLTSKDELRLIDMTIRMLVEPKFQLDTDALMTALVEEKERKRTALLDLAHQLGDDTDDEEDAVEAVQTTLNSAAKFGQLLASLGCEVPTKISPRTGKEAPALSKTDEEFLSLREHEHPLVRTAVEARLGTKSTILESRITAFLEAGEAAGGKLPVPLKYYGGHTGRWSGWGYNPQNLPRVSGKPTDVLRKSLLAPPGHKIVVCDLSGIELRVNHFLWKVPSSMELYQESPDKADLYKDFASKMYNVPVEGVTKDQRQVGKVCLAEGTLVLTKRGEVPIEQVLSSDRVWDGVEWVSTLGPIYNGECDVIEYDGITATPDHEVWVEDGRKVQIGDAAAQLLRLARTGDGRTPLGFSGVGVERGTSDKGASRGVDTLHRVRHDEVRELLQLAEREDTGVSIVSSKVRRTEMASTTDGVSPTAVHESERCRVQELRGEGDSVQVLVGKDGSGVGNGELRSAQGARDRQDRHGRSLRTGESALRHGQGEHSHKEKRALDTVPLVQTETSRSPVRGQYAEEHDLPRVDGQADSGAVEHTVMQAKRRVWDLLNCGPRHRFTANGRLVSNCHLGLGFGAGYRTFVKVAKTMGGVTLSEEESASVVQKWRTEYVEIARGWKKCQAVFPAIRAGVQISIDPWGLCVTGKDVVTLPSGRHLRYPDMREVEEDGRRSWKFGAGRNEKFMTGGKMDENLVQAIARDVIAGHALEVFKLSGHRPCLMVHDELVYVIPDDEADEHLALLNKVMRTPPKWWPELVLSAAGDIADSYGAAK